METVFVSDLAAHVGERVRIRGWLYNRRSSKKLQFLLVRDGTGIVQAVVAKADVEEPVWETASELAQESSLEITGTIRADERSPGGVELGVEGVTLLGESVDYPITKKEHGDAFLLDHRHLWLRSRRPHAILRIRSELVYAIREWLRERGFVNVDTPIFTPNACEGTTTLFETDYFDLGKAYLSQSGQLYNEATAAAFNRVYCFGPTFRAEKSKTRRHLTEFWMVEPEVAFLDLEGNMKLIEEFVSGIVARILDRCAEDLKVLERDTSALEKVVPPFPRLAYDDATKLLHDKGIDFAAGGDFGAEDETVLSSGYDKPLLVHRFPSAIKAFYMKSDPLDPRLSLSVDLLAPEGYGEVVGGGERETRLEVLEERIREENLPGEAFQWYLDLRRYGTVPHSGFGMGVERALSWICGLSHLRETIPFPRMIHRLGP